MNREVIFRGKSVKDGRWIYGVPGFSEYEEGDSYGCILYAFEHSPATGFVSPENRFFVDVYPSTISQYTGLKTKSGNFKFEFDILAGDPHGSVMVIWNDEYACFESSYTTETFDEEGNKILLDDGGLFANDLKDCFDTWEVIGNKFENPDLIP